MSSQIKPLKLRGEEEIGVDTQQHDFFGKPLFTGDRVVYASGGTTDILSDGVIVKRYIETGYSMSSGVYQTYTQPVFLIKMVNGYKTIYHNCIRVS